MAHVDKLWLAALTKKKHDAGTDTGKLNLTVNIAGADVLDRDFKFLAGTGHLASGLGPESAWLGEGQAAISDAELEKPFDQSLLSHSSFRLGVRTPDAWGPQHALLLGRSERRVIALALETEIEEWLSTDSGEGKLSMPVRLVGQGSDQTAIRRVMLLVYTGPGIDVESKDAIQLQITAKGNLVLQQQIPSTSQNHLQQYTANWHFLDAAVPFTRGDVLANGGARLSILGPDAWLPKSVFVFGLDTAAGRPNHVVHLVSIPDWSLGKLSTDAQEGKQSVDLPVS